MGFSIRKVNALFYKEIKDIGKNMNVLFICTLPIIFSILYSKLFGDVVEHGEIGKQDILIICVGMNLVLVSSYVIAMLIAEEKEKNTLRTLLLSGLSPLEFLTGKVLVTLLMTEVVNIAIFFILGMEPQYLLQYLLLTTLVVLCMIEIGAIIGIIAPNQMATGVVGMPVLMFLLLIPMFADLDKTFAKIAEFLPNYNMNLLLERVFTNELMAAGSAYNIGVILIWILLAGTAFIFTYNKVGLDK